MGDPDAKTVLIIEDYEDDAKLLQLLLASAGITNPVRVVLSAEAAISYLQAIAPPWGQIIHPLPAVIFVDLKLPGIDGFECLRWLRARREFEGLFVVVLSAAGDMASIQTAYALGANSFLTKPCRAADLENLVACYPAFWTRTIPPLPPAKEQGQPPAGPTIPG